VPGAWAGRCSQYTVNATLMNIADNPTNVQLPGQYNKDENPRSGAYCCHRQRLLHTVHATLGENTLVSESTDCTTPTKVDKIGYIIDGDPHDLSIGGPIGR
jgi:hypothetical protein